MNWISFHLPSATAKTNFLDINASFPLSSLSTHILVGYTYYLLCSGEVSLDLVQLQLVVKGHQGDPFPGSVLDV